MKTFTTTLLAFVSILFCTQIGNSQFSLAFDCGDNVSVEACGSGAIDSTTVTLCIPDTASLDSILVELAVKGDSSTFGPTTITTSAGEVVVVEFDEVVENIGSNEEAAIYRAWVQPASKITATNPSSDPFLEDWQSMTAFKLRRNLDCVGGSASLEGILLYHACDTLTFEIPQTIAARNVTICAPISEYGDGAPRTAYVTIDAIHNDTVWQQYSFIDTLDADSNITDFLLIYQSMIMDLPGEVDTIKVGFLSPGPPNGCLPGDGDSFVVGTVAVSAECDPGDCCIIEPICPPDENGECIADITPIPASMLDTIAGSDSTDFVNLGGEVNLILCDSFHIRAMDDTVGMGCPGDPYIITRTFDFYTQQNVLDASCTQTFTFIDSIRPEIACPADVTAECLEVILPFADFYEFLAAGGTASDNCALDTPSFVMISELSDGLSCPETITRMYEIADSCGLLDTCTHIVMVDDDLAPMITCPIDVTLECTDDTSPTANGAGMATATDLCDVTISVSGVMTPGDCPQEYTMVRTWTAVDGCGNSVSCNQNITVVDSTPPDITCPADATVECTVDPTLYITGMATATDNCSDVTVAYADVTAAGNCPAEYTITRTWTAVDACGNEASCPQVINILDTGAPDLMCAPSVTIECDESTDPANTGTSTATDECSDVTVTYQDATITDELCIQVIQRRWKATDECGNTSECDQLITVVDSQVPDLVCPAEVTIECTDDPTDLALTGEGTATDACNDVTVTYNDDPVAGDCMGNSSIYRVWTATDACDNNTSCVQIIHIVDTQAPDLECPADITLECNADTSPTANGAGIASATDACSDDVTITVTGSITLGDCPQEYTMVRTWTAVDDCGNSVSCDQTITVVDTNPPAINCPEDIDVECTETTAPMAALTVDFDGMFADVLFVDQNTPSNDYSNSGLTFDGSGVANGWEVLDIVSFPITGLSNPNKLAWNSDFGPTGNTEAMNFAPAASGISFKIGMGSGAGSTITFNVYNSANVLVETQSPVVGNAAVTVVIASSDVARIEISAPSVSAGCLDDISYMGGTGKATAEDACGDVTVTYSDASAPGDCLAESTITRTWTAVDACGNAASCDQLINIVDSTDPDLMCAPNITIECDESTDPANTGTSTATDECSDVTVTYQDATITDELCLQVIQRRWKATDACGNTTECDQLISVVDSQAPDLVCPAEVTIECSDDPTDLALTGEANATDACNDVTVTYSDDPVAGDCMGNSTIYRGWIATDACGNNTACIQIIHIVDTQAPDLECPADVTLQCTDDTSPTANGAGIASATDACSDDVTITVSGSLTPGDCPQEYTMVRTWTAVDDCGNSVSCEQTVVVVDANPPDITCPADATVECTEDPTPDVTGMATATDACGDVTISYTDATVEGDCPAEYTITRTWTAVDACGNESSCPQTIEVLDTQGPDLTCAQDITIECTESADPDNTGVASASDACGDVTVTYSDVTTTDEVCLRVIKRTWNAVDECGNMAECDQFISIVDSAAPDLTCAADITIECDASTLPDNTGWSTATDACNDVSVTYVDDPGQGPCMGESVIYRIWTATDACGNSTSCPQLIEIFDTTPPQWTYCPADATVECTDIVDPQNTNGWASATDACSDVTVTYADVTSEGDCANEYTIERTWTAVDDCGNNTSKIHTIEVLDITPPVITCPADATLECTEDPNPDLTGEATATDECGDVTLTYSDITAQGLCPSEYTITRTWTAVDACGNESSCPQIINVLDIHPPVVTCAQDVTIECDESTLPINTGFTTATDECGGPVTITYQQATMTNELCLKVILRRWKVTDDCNNTSECDQYITVKDTQGPEVTGPDDMTVECDESTSPADTGEATATDNCNGATVDYVDEIVPGECEGEYTILRTWTAVDACGNECDGSIANNGDFESGSLAPEWDGIGNTTANTADGDILPAEGSYQARISSSNDVDQASLETFLELPGGTLDALGPGDVTSGSAIKQTITAVAGQTLTFRWNFATDELDQPVVFNDFGFVTIVDNNVVILATRLDPGFLPTTNYDGQTGYMDFSHTFASSGTCVLGFGVTDVSDNIVESSLFVDAVDLGCPVQTIHVVDTKAPVWTDCPADVTVECTESTDTQNTGGWASATDACSDVTVTYADVTSEGDCDNEYTIERTWTATDDCENNTSKVQTIEILDTNPPVITCPGDVTVECTDSTDPDNTGMATATDECGDVTITYSDAVVPGFVPADCPAEYTITRTWTAVDACGNESDCDQTIMVLDTQAPDLMCAADITIECDESTDPADTGASTATDECSDVTVTYQDATITDELCEQVIQRRWKATDACGNTSECDQLITVKDTQGPEVTSPEDMTVQCDESTDPSATGEATATDNCTEATVSYVDAIIPGDCDGEYTILRTWNAVDECDNSCTNIGNGDFESGALAPEWEGIGNTTANTADGDIVPVQGSYQARISSSNDVSQGAIETFLELPSGTLDALGPGNVTSGSAIKQTVTAVAGQTLTFSWNFATDELDQLPIFNDFGFVTIVDNNVVILATKLDPGFLPTTNYDGQTGYMTFSHTFASSGTCVLGFGVTDVADNIVESTLFVDAITGCPVQRIDVVDTTPPVWTNCPADVTVECTESTDTQNTGGWASATDACSDVTVTYSDVTSEGDCENEYTIERTWTAVDDCGNNTSKVQTIEVLDITPPVMTCPADATIECTEVPHPDLTGEASATDDCGDVTVTYADVTAEGNCPAEYTITRTWTAVDACGNESSCPQTIEVLDIQDPELTCAADVTIECDESTEPAHTGWTTATDNCSDVTITYDDALITDETCLQVILRRWNVTDECGNTTECDQLITVKDTQGPEATSPEDMTVQCDESTDPSATGEATATDNCNGATVDYVDEIVPGECEGEYTILRTWTAVDACGNECDGSIANNGDFESGSLAPEWDGIGNTTANTADGDILPDEGSYQARISSSNDVDQASLETFLELPGGTLDALGPGDVTSGSAIKQTITAVAGQTLTFRWNFATDELDQPVVFNDFGFVTIVDNNVVILATRLDPGFLPTTNYDGQTGYMDFSHTFASSGTCVLGFGVTDVSDNIVESSLFVDAVDLGCPVQTIHVVDTKAPVWTDCPADVTVECTESTDTQNTGGWASATDACSDVTVTYSDVTSEGDCENEYTIERTWTAVDDCGNNTSKVQTIEVLDITPPVMTCPADATIECTEVPHTDLTGEASATDDCGDVTVTYADVTAEGNCPAEYTITRTWTAVDACGNESSCPQTIEVLDIHDPVLTCAADVTIECDESTEPAHTGWTTATDNCSDVTVTYQDATITDELCEQVIQRRWKATDACGNTSECDQLITVKDTQGPEVTSPEDMTVQCDESTDPSATGEATATDNCTEATVSYVDAIIPGDCDGEYTILRTWNAVDECDNSCTNIGNGDFESGALAPEWEGIGNTTANTADGDIVPVQGSYQARISSSNDVSQGAIETFLELPSGTLDALGPGNVTSGSAIKQTVTAVAGQTLTFSWNFATDELDQLPIFNDFGFVTIVDNNVVILATKLDPGFLPTTNYDGQTGYMTFSHTFASSGTCVLGFGVTDVADNIVESTLFVDAITGCPVQRIDVVDTTPPVWTNCPADVTVECTESTDTQNTGGWASATDACSDVTVSYADVTSEGDCDNEYTIERTWTAVDDCGNNTSKVQTIEVLDITPPVITCPADATIECTEVPHPDLTGEASATDDCGDVTVTYADVTAEGNCPAEYTITRTWTAVDACGNESSCPQTIEVLDIQDPELTCAADVTIECDESTEPDNTGWTTATDNCSDVTVTYQDAELDGQCPLVKTIVRRWTATDACGNTTECDQTIEVYDLEGPTITCPDDVTANADKFYCEKVQVEIGFPTWTDNCDEDVTVSYTRSDGADIGAAYPVGVTEIEWVVLGLCSGESDTCVQTITILDSQPPTVICKKISVALNDDEGLVMVPPQFLYDGVFDNCTDEEYLEGTITVSQSIFSCADYPQVLVEVCATDEAGNVGCCFATVKIQDNFAPNAVCQDVTIDAGGNASVVITGADIDGGSTDNTDDCGLDMDVAPSVFDADGNHDVTLTVTDIAGNESTCTSTVTITGIPANNSAQITGKIWIEGAMNATQTAMIPYINDLLPLAQPFNMAPFNYEGNEVVDAMPIDAIDWVLVELRDEADPTMVIRTRAGLLMSDGYVKDLDGVTPITFDNLGDGMYYLSVSHRNHLGVISDAAIEVLAGQGIHDFTTGGAMGAEPMKLMSEGAYALWCGDLNADGVIDAGDRSIAWNMRNQTGYLQADATMDGVVDSSERSVTWNNRNKASGLPQ